MNKKKFLAMLLACIMMLALATGCGSDAATTPADSAPAGNDAGSDAGSDAPSASGPFKIALIQQHQTNAFQIAVTEAAEAKAAELGAELKILSADQDAAQAQATVESWLSAYDLDAIVCENDGMAVGAGNAAGANSGIIISGVDGTPDGFEAIKDGRITGTVSQNGGAMAANGIEAAVTLLSGGTLETNVLVTDNTWIDASNVADYE